MNPMNKLEFKSTLAIDEAGRICGTAWPFGSPDRVGDMIEKGAFASAVAPVPMLFSHNPDKPVGAWTSIQEDANGLQVEGQLLVEDVPLAKEARALVRAGAMRGLSIGFTTRKAFNRKGGGRTITDLELVEISLVSIPMHPNARINSAKTAADAIAIAAAINRATAQLTKGN
ncbi:MAG: HK97 family phage prohead protease [Beijerinckiaceae bacterium]